MVYNINMYKNKTKRQGGKIDFGIILGGTAVCLILVMCFLALKGLYNSSKELQEKANKRLELCLTIADKAGLDPQQEKIDFIRDCME